MPESDDLEKLIAEVAEIDSQMEALSVRKRQCLSKFPKGYTQKIRLGGIFNDYNGRYGVEIALRGAESNDELAEVLAEAVVYLGERGLLPLKNEPIPTLPPALMKTDQLSLARIDQDVEAEFATFRLMPRPGWMASVPSQAGPVWGCAG